MKSFITAILGAILLLGALPASAFANFDPPPANPNAVDDPTHTPGSQPSATTNVSSAMGATFDWMFETAGIEHRNFGKLREAYNKNGGFPILDGTLGIGVGKIMANPTINYIFWSIITLCAALAAGFGLKDALGGKNPLGDLASLSSKLAIGAVVIANRGLLYALLVTTMSSVAAAIKYAKESGKTPAVLNYSLADSAFPRAYNEELSRRAVQIGAAYEHAGSDDDLAEHLKNTYDLYQDALAKQTRTAGVGVEAPAIPKMQVDAAKSDKHRAKLYGGWLGVHAPRIIIAMGSAPAGHEFTTPNGSIPSLQSSLAEANKILERHVAGTGRDALIAHQQKLADYTKALQGPMDTWAEKVITVMPPGNVDLADRFLNWFRSMGDLIPDIGGKLMGFVSSLADAVIDAMTSTQVVWAAAVTIGALLLIEAQLFVMMLAYPLFLIPKFEKAFLGPLRMSISAALWLPVYTFLMLIVDGIFGFFMKLTLIGGAVTAGGAAAVTVAGALPMLAVGAVGYIVTILVFCIAYFVAAGVTAAKTPGWIAKFMEGVDVAGNFLMKQAIMGAEGMLMAMKVGTLAAGGAGAGLGSMASAGGGAGGGAAPGAAAGASPIAAGSNPAASAGGGAGSTLTDVEVIAPSRSKALGMFNNKASDGEGGIEELPMLADGAEQPQLADALPEIQESESEVGTPKTHDPSLAPALANGEAGPEGLELVPAGGDENSLVEAGASSGRSISPARGGQSEESSSEPGSARREGPGGGPSPGGGGPVNIVIGSVVLNGGGGGPQGPKNVTGTAQEMAASGAASAGDAAAQRIAPATSPAQPPTGGGGGEDASGGSAPQGRFQQVIKTVNTVKNDPRLQSMGREIMRGTGTMMQADNMSSWYAARKSAGSRRDSEEEANAASANAAKAAAEETAQEVRRLGAKIDQVDANSRGSR